MRLYTTYWLPQVTYAVGLLWDTPPASFISNETIILRIAMSTPHHPVVVLRSIAGLPTPHTRFDLDRLRVLCRLLNSPPTSPVRQQLCVEVVRYHQSQQAAHQRRLWWHGTHTLLSTLDGVCDADFWRSHTVLPADITPPSFLAWATANALAYTHATIRVNAVHSALRDAMLVLEGHRRGRELERCAASLDEGRDLLDTPNMAPFLADTRTEATACRVQLYGGRRTLFGYDHFHVARCPWCGLDGQFTVPHLLRDCPSSEHERLSLWTMAKDVLVTAGLCDEHNVCDHRQEWYRLMCGASVPHTFVHLHLDAPTHFARPDHAPATRHLRRHMAAYRRVLHLTGQYLQLVVAGTFLRLETAREDLPRGVPHTRRVRRVNHHRREREAAVLDHQPQPLSPHVLAGQPADSIVAQPSSNRAHRPGPSPAALAESQSSSPAPTVVPASVSIPDRLWAPPPHTLEGVIAHALAPFPALRTTAADDLDPMFMSLLRWWAEEEPEDLVAVTGTPVGTAPHSGVLSLPVLSPVISDAGSSSGGEASTSPVLDPNWMFEG